VRSKHFLYVLEVCVGIVAPLDRLAVRQISSRYLSQYERIEIADLRQSGLSMRAIARQLGRGNSIRIGSDRIGKCCAATVMART
jgi:transposase, IS30 family